MAKLLLVEDDLTFTKLIQNFLIKHGYEVESCTDIKSSLIAIRNGSYDLLLLDYRLPDGNSLDLLATLRDEGIILPSLIMTSFQDIRTAVKAMRSGVLDYITKPINPEELLMVLKETFTRPQVAPTSKKPTPATSRPAEFIEGVGEASKQVFDYVRLVAPTDMSVIVQGESGTGKENISRMIHLNSKRGDKPFVAIDCGALSKDLASSELFGHVKGAFTGALMDKKGQFEMANGGTLFLDEIGNLGYDVQIKLLRVLQERIVVPVGSSKPVKVDVRVIVATNDDLLSSVAKGDFREDLYHRLNEFKIHVPALRERREDMNLFISHFLQKVSHELNKNVTAISPDLQILFAQYDWPGNLRELNNVIKRLVLLTTGETAQTDALPEDMLKTLQKGPLVTYSESNNEVKNNPSDLKALKEEQEKEMIERVLTEVKFNKTKAAKILNIDRKTLYYKIGKYQIE